MWSFDANKCTVCNKKETCPDRKKILRAISPVVNEINLDEASEGQGGDGVIIVACRAGS